jgi:hypothetical protein
MSPKTLRILGIACMVVAAVIAILNLRRVANLGVFFLPAIFIVLGAAFFIRAKNRRL